MNDQTRFRNRIIKKDMKQNKRGDTNVRWGVLIWNYQLQCSHKTFEITIIKRYSMHVVEYRQILKYG